MTSPIATALENAVSAIEAAPDKARAKYAPATAILTSGLKCHVNGPHGARIETDMSPAMGGEAAAPNPGWYFRAALAACCSTAIAMNAARRAIVLTRLEVTVEGDGDNRGILGMGTGISAGHAALRTNVTISASNATPDELRELVRFAEEHAPVGATVRDSAPNTLHIVVA